MQRWHEVQAQMKAILAETRSISDKAEQEGRDLSAEEQAQVERLFARFNEIAPPERPSAEYYRRLRVQLALIAGG